MLLRYFLSSYNLAVIASIIVFNLVAADAPHEEPFPVAHQRKELEYWKTNLKYQLTPEFTSLIAGHNEEIPVGTLLYHGTLHALHGGMPNMPVNFFSFDINQAQAHPLNRFDDQHPASHPPRLYTYRVKKAIPHILKIDEQFSFKPIFETLHIDEKHHPDNQKIGRSNHFVALILKMEREAGRLNLNGFSHRNDQNELELDDPGHYLELVSVHEFGNKSYVDNPWFDPVENHAQTLPCIEGTRFKANPLYTQNYGVANMNHAKAVSAQRRFLEHEKRYKRWVKSLANYVDKDRVDFVCREHNGVMKNYYDYTAEQFKHVWILIEEK